MQMSDRFLRGTPNIDLCPPHMYYAGISLLSSVSRPYHILQIEVVCADHTGSSAECLELWLSALSALVSLVSLGFSEHWLSGN